MMCALSLICTFIPLIFLFSYFLDFSKAFDSLEWDFMFSTLKHYGFNYSFVTWVETLFDYIQTCVINNGWISEIFKNKSMS
jgi:hypothetical protein